MKEYSFSVITMVAPDLAALTLVIQNRKLMLNLIIYIYISFRDMKGTDHAASLEPRHKKISGYKCFKL